jgi:hypothetical protein
MSRNAYKIFVVKPQGKDHLGDLGKDDGKTTIKWILEK